MPLKIAYGEANFENLRKDKYLYIDKTHYIPLMEGYKKFFFIRPRRFGKSLWISVLMYYYDINSKGKFDTLFDGLYIQSNPTEYKNSYLTLYLNFSGIRGNTIEELQKAFDFSIRDYIKTFFYQYKGLLNKEKDFSFETISQGMSSADMIKYLISEVRNSNYRVYVLIDEYDHFINTLVSEGREVFANKMITGSGFVRGFYEQLKIGSDSGALERFYITGVSPIMLDELASGFNIMNNMTTELEFNEMLGFTEEEVWSILDKVDDSCYKNKTKEDVFKELVYYYNGYKFSDEATKTMFNSDMILYFFQSFRNKGRYPSEILDLNVKTDYGKLKGLVVGSSGKEQLKEIIHELNLKNEISFRMVQRFTFDSRLKPDELRSLLFYFGLLTVGTSPGQYRIPNSVIRTLHWEYLQKFLEESGIEFNTDLLHKAIHEMASMGEVDTLKELAVDFFYNRLSSFDFANLSEKHIKFFFVSYFTLSNFYNVVSEREIGQRKRIDLLFEAHPAYYNYILYNYIVELKYIKKTDTAEEATQKRNDAISQAKEYYEIYKRDFKQFGRELKSLALIVSHTREVEMIKLGGFDDLLKQG